MAKIFGGLVGGATSAIGGFLTNAIIKRRPDNLKINLGVAVAIALPTAFLIKKLTGASLINMALSFAGGFLLENVFENAKSSVKGAKPPSTEI